MPFRYASLKNKIPTWNLNQATVFLHADLNIPYTQDGVLIDDFRLQRLIPTLTALLPHARHLLLATHLESETTPIATELIMQWLQKQRFDTSQIKLIIPYSHASDETAYAHELKGTASFYINDAFASAHRTDVALTLLPTLFPPENHSIGFLIAEEIQKIDAYLANPSRPFVALLGGGKGTMKLPLVYDLLASCDHILLCPGLSTPFHQHSTRTSSEKAICAKILERARPQQLLLPLDYLTTTHSLMAPPYQVKEATKLQAGELPVAIGPKTRDQWLPYLQDAQLVLVNGPMGFRHYPETRAELNVLLRAIAQSVAVKIAGGGDTVALLHETGFESQFTYCSTGGGSLLAYITQQILPAFEPLLGKKP